MPGVRLQRGFVTRNRPAGRPYPMRTPSPQGARHMKKSTLVASAVASLFALGVYAADKAPAKDAKAAAANVKCTGVNECKGKGACAGAGNACAGKNECKGHGV